MDKAANMSLWTGRDDGNNKERWYQHIIPLKDSAPAGVALLGVASDEGVKRNHGRQVQQLDWQAHLMPLLQELFL